jgi:hypothetical protein
MWFIAYSHHKGIIIWVELAQQQQQQHNTGMNCELSSVNSQS